MTAGRASVAHQPEWSLAKRNPGTATGDLLGQDDPLAFIKASGTALVISYSSQAKGYFDKAIAGAVDDVTARAYDNPREPRDSPPPRRHRAAPRRHADEGELT